MCLGNNHILRITGVTIVLSHSSNPVALSVMATGQSKLGIQSGKMGIFKQQLPQGHLKHIARDSQGFHFYILRVIVCVSKKANCLCLSVLPILQ